MSAEELLPATFRGVSFLVNSDETAAGKRIATHEYVNSDERFDEELGLIPSRYKMTGWVTSLASRIALERALKAPGLGWLVHPIYGGLRAMAQPYTVRGSQSEQGLYTFSLAFNVSREVVTATKTLPTAANIADWAALARAAASNSLKISNLPPSDVPGGGSEGAGSPEGLPQTAEEIESATEQATTVFESITNGLKLARNVVQREAATFTSTMNGLLRDVGTIVRTAEGMKEALESAYVALNNVVNTPSDLYDSYLSLTDISYVKFFPSTVSRQRRAIFGFVLSEHTRLTGLAGLAAAMADTNYETQQQVLDDLELWQSLYESMVRVPDDSLQGQVASYLQPNAAPVVREVDTQNTFQGLSSAFSGAMLGKQQNAWRVAERKVTRGSLYLLTYQLYGGLDNLDLIRGLNPEGLTGDVNVGEQ